MMTDEPINPAGRVPDDDPIAQEERRAAEEELMAQRNAAQRDAGQENEQALILPGEPDAAAVTGLDDEDAGGRTRPSDASEDVERTVDLGGRDD